MYEANNSRECLWVTQKFAFNVIFPNKNANIKIIQLHEHSINLRKSKTKVLDCSSSTL